MWTDIVPDEKVVVITGAARGVGAYTARRLADRGWRVGILDVLEDEAASLAAEIGPAAAVFRADVADPASVTTAVRACAEHFGYINAVVANAGAARVHTLAAGNVANFDRTLKVNVAGPGHTVRAALPHLRESRGYALLVSSIAAALHPPLRGPYATGRTGIEAISDALRIETTHTGIDIGVGYFSSIDTPLNRLVSLERAGEAMVSAVERRARCVYAPRWGRPVLHVRGLLPRVVAAQLGRAAMHDAVSRSDAVRLRSVETGASARSSRARD